MAEAVAAIFALLFASMQADSPRTVNGQILGDAADFTTAGPATICMLDLAVEAAAGERVALTYLGFHNGSLRWEGANGAINFRQSEIWRKPRYRGRFVSSIGGFFLYRTREEGKVTYLAFRMNEDGKEYLDTRISGTLFKGTRDDERLLARLLKSSGTSPKCDRRYSYGRDMILGDEPVTAGPSDG